MRFLSPPKPFLPTHKKIGSLFEKGSDFLFQRTHHSVLPGPLRFFPGRRRKEEQHGEDLQPAKQHIQRQDKLGKTGEAAEIPHRPHQIQAHPDGPLPVGGLPDDFFPRYMEEVFGVPIIGSEEGENTVESYFSGALNGQKDAYADLVNSKKYLRQVRRINCTQSSERSYLPARHAHIGTP